MAVTISRQNAVMKRALWGLATLCFAALVSGCDNSVSLVALTSTGSLITFTTSKPTDIQSSVSVFGLPTGTSLVQIVFRPADGVLYGVTSANQLVSVDQSSGAVSLVGTGVAFTTTSLGNVQGSWNPATDLLRLITGADNLTVSVAGALVSNDTRIAFGASDPNAGKSPDLAAVAYDNNSTLFGLDVTSQSLLIIGGGGGSDPAAAGILGTVGSLGVSFGSSAGMAIQSSTDTAYAALAPAGTGASLYTVDLQNGAASFINTIGSGTYTIISLASPP